MTFKLSNNHAAVRSHIGNIAGLKPSWAFVALNEWRDHMVEKKILVTGATGGTLSRSFWN
jgi:hypothetical protein